MSTPVILLDCNLRNTEGIIYSFGKRKVPVIGLSADPNPPAFQSRYVQKKLISPHISQEEEYLCFLTNLEERGVIMCSDDASAAFLSRHRDFLRSRGFLLNVPEAATFERAFNKDKVFEECRKAGVPTIPTWKINSLSDFQRVWDENGGPLLIKPTRLAGGHYVIVRRQEDLEEAYGRIRRLVMDKAFEYRQSEIIAQEFIQARYQDLYCCETYYSPDARPAGFLTIRKERPDINRDGTAGSRLYAGVSQENEQLEQYTRKLLDHLQWKGFGHVEYIYSAKYQDYLLCEVNPRLPGFSNYLTKVGFEIAWHYYADLVGIKYGLPAFRKSVYMEALRVPGDLTSSLYAVFKGYMSGSDFIRPYLRIFQSGYIVCIDVFFRQDPLFTLAYWSKFLRYLLLRPFKRQHAK